MQPTTARLFFALWPDGAMQAALAAPVSEIELGPDSRAVPAKNFHLTLAFLGAVPQSRFEALSEIAARFARAFDPGALPLRLTLDTVEHWSKSQVLCATASETPPATVSLGESLQAALSSAEFTPDLKTFHPHVTLARNVKRRIRPAPIPSVEWSFNGFVLVQSQTLPTGSVYEILESFPLTWTTGQHALL